MCSAHMVHIECVVELDICFVKIIVSDFTQLFRTLHSSKLCNVIGAPLSKRQVTTKARTHHYPVSYKFF
jgi:hypothetical protein